MDSVVASGMSTFGRLSYETMGPHAIKSLANLGPSGKLPDRPHNLEHPPLECLLDTECALDLVR